MRESPSIRPDCQILSCLLERCCELNLWMLSFYIQLCVPWSLPPAPLPNVLRNPNFVLISSSRGSCHQSRSGTSVETAKVWFTFCIHCQVQLAGDSLCFQKTDISTLSFLTWYLSVFFPNLYHCHTIFNKLKSSQSVPLDILRLSLLLPFPFLYLFLLNE